MLKQYITRFSRKSILHLKKPGHPSEIIVTHPLTKYNSLFLIFIVFFTKEYESEKARKYRRKSCVLCAGRLFHFPLISFLFYFFIIIKGNFLKFWCESFILKSFFLEILPFSFLLLCFLRSRKKFDLSISFLSEDINMKEILQMEMTRWILGRRLGLYNLTSRKRKPYNQPTAEGDEPPQAHARQLPLRGELWHP